jgi:Zn-finger nucleic acid-binding protein
MYMLSCPKCGSVLTTKKVKTAASGSIDVDFCETCGGVYFDRGEINRISKEDAEKLSHSETHGTPRDGSNRCPKCGASLERYWGESVPSDVYVLRCPDCSGTWFTKAELTKFKDAQSAKINYFRTWKIPLSSLSSVLIPVALFVVLTGSTLIVADQVQRRQQTTSNAQEMMTNPSVIKGENGSSVTVVFTTQKDATTQFLINGYQGHDGVTTLPISVKPKKTHEVTLTGLIPGQTYFYRIHVITGEESFYSNEYNFSL